MTGLYLGTHTHLYIHICIYTMYIYLYIHAAIIKENEAAKLKDSKETYIRELKRKRRHKLFNDILNEKLNYIDAFFLHSFFFI